MVKGKETVEMNSAAIKPRVRLDGLAMVESPRWHHVDESTMSARD
jgi:hypothetical protein